ncbi:MAG: hypothetical protein ACKVP4_12960, partial [Hyphomicrobium sp.]
MRFATVTLFAALAAWAGPCHAQAPAPESAKSDEAASNLLRGNANQAVADYTEALKDTGLANDRRAALLNDRA